MEQKRCIDYSLGLGYAGNEEKIYNQIATVFYQMNEDRMHKLVSLLEEENWKNYGIEVHALKGNALNIGAKVLSEKAKELEFLAKDVAGMREPVTEEQRLEKIVQIKEKHPYLVEENENVMRELLTVYHIGIQTDNKIAIEGKGRNLSSEELKGKLEVLCDHLDIFEVDEALEIMDELLQSGCDKVDLMEKLTAVKEQIADYDCDEAQEVVLELLKTL